MLSPPNLKDLNFIIYFFADLGGVQASITGRAEFVHLTVPNIRIFEDISYAGYTVYKYVVP